MRAVPYLFKYLAPERVDVLERLMIRFTQPERLNDPFECDPFVERGLSPHALKSSSPLPSTVSNLARYGAESLADGALLVINDGATPRLCDASKIGATLDALDDASLRTEIELMLSTSVQSALRCAFAVLCLSARCDNVLMWSHYTRNHRGFVIGFDASHPFFRVDWQYPSVSLATANPVAYTRHRPEFHFVTDLTKAAVFLTKSTEWEYEREWRMVRTVEEADEVSYEGSDAPVYLFAVPPDAINSIILGAASSYETRERVTAALSANVHLRHVRMFNAELDSRRFRLNVTPARSTAGKEPAELERA